MNATAASAVPGSPTTACRAATNSTKDSAPRNPIPISAALAPVSAPRMVSMARTPPHATSRANRVAAAARHHSRRREPSRNRPSPPRTLGTAVRGRPAREPERSPLGSGATSSWFAPRCIDRDAAVSAPVSACCCRTPSAPAVTIVTGPLGGTISAAAVDCERTLRAAAWAVGCVPGGSRPVRHARSRLQPWRSPPVGRR